MCLLQSNKLDPSMIWMRNKETVLQENASKHHQFNSNLMLHISRSIINKTHNYSNYTPMKLLMLKKNALKSITCHIATAPPFCLALYIFPTKLHKYTIGKGKQKLTVLLACLKMSLLILKCRFKYSECARQLLFLSQTVFAKTHKVKCVLIW